MVRWIPTTAAVYNAVRLAHNENMTVHGTITDIGEYNGPGRLMTEWGLAGADYPLIKRDTRDGISNYFIAVLTRDEE